MTDGDAGNQSGQKAGSSKPGSQNRREFERFDWEATVRVAWIHEHPPLDPLIINLQACNISGGGICLRMRTMVHPGQFGVVHLGNGPKAESMVRGILVRHCDYDSEIHEYIVGCAWAGIPSNVKAEFVHGSSGSEFRVRLVDGHPSFGTDHHSGSSRKSA